MREFARVLADEPRDARALFGAANLAYEQGDVDKALDHALSLVEVASQGGDKVALALAAPMLSRIPRLLYETVDRRPFESRLLAISPGHLPWQARYALALAGIDSARKRGDRALLDAVSRAAGCVDDVVYAGDGGKLAFLDLDADNFKSVSTAAPLVPTGCAFQLNAADLGAAVRVVRATLDIREAGAFDVVLDFAGPARFRVDQGAWRKHGGTREAYGPRWSSARVDMRAGRHVVEVRLGMFGPSAEFALLASPSTQPDVTLSASSSADRALDDLAQLLQGNLMGDTDRLLTQIDRLSSLPSFAVGLAAAARLGETDPTRPADILRDKARALWQAASTTDATLARVWLDLSRLDMQTDRPREAAEKAERARAAAPNWWPAYSALASALRAQGLEQPADAALVRGMALVESGQGGCAMIDQAFLRREERDDVADLDRLAGLLSRCDVQNDMPRLLARRRGDLRKTRALLERALPTSAEPLWLRSDIADVDMGLGDPNAARAELSVLRSLVPRDTRLSVRLADAEAALGRAEQSKAILAEASRRFPGRQDVIEAGRHLGVPMPLESYRLDGARVIADYVASNRRYQAPAVVVLDRAVEQVYPDGARAVLTHSITQVLSKDAIETVGEVHLPAGAVVLGLRARKADGTLREAEEIAGKTSISVPNLVVGDFVESETLEIKEPSEAFAPGFIGERFYFQSFEAPLDRSEYIFIAPADMRLDIDRRAGAPMASERTAADGNRILTFVVKSRPQAFAERAAVPAREWIPSVMVTSGASLAAWSRYFADRFARVSRASPEIRRVAREIGSRTGKEPGRLAEAIVAWVREHIEPEADVVDLATSTLSRGRGNRTGLILALAHVLDVPVDVLLVRSRLAAESSAPVGPADLDEFRDVIVRFPLPDGDRFVDPQIRHAPFAYVFPWIDGAPGLLVGSPDMVMVSSGVRDSRSVTLRGQLDAEGGATVEVTEQLTGLPAVEWNEILDQTGKDTAKLRREFEQRWLGHHFPGAQLDTLSIEPGEGSDGTRVRYSFRAARLAARQGGLLRLRPSFFQSQPGRRFASEPQRGTSLQLGYDIPLALDAEFRLPSGARVVDIGPSGEASAPGARFLERRRIIVAPDQSQSIHLRRESRLSIGRVSPFDYQGVAAKLRGVDSVEQSEIQIALPGK